MFVPTKKKGKPGRKVGPALVPVCNSSEDEQIAVTVDESCGKLPDSQVRNNNINPTRPQQDFAPEVAFKPELEAVASSTEKLEELAKKA